MKNAVNPRKFCILLFLFVGSLYLKGQPTMQTFKVANKKSEKSWLIDYQKIDGESYLIKYNGISIHEGVYFSKVDAQNRSVKEFVIPELNGKVSKKGVFFVEYLGFRNKKWYFHFKTLDKKKWTLGNYLGIIDTNGEFSELLLDETIYAGRKDLFRNLELSFPSVVSYFADSSFGFITSFSSNVFSLYQFTNNGALLDKRKINTQQWFSVGRAQLFIDSDNNTYCALHKYKRSQSNFIKEGTVFYYAYIDQEEHELISDLGNQASHRASFYEEDGVVYCLDLLSNVEDKKPKEISANIYRFDFNGIKLVKGLDGEFERGERVISKTNFLDENGDRFFVSTGYHEGETGFFMGNIDLIKLSENFEIEIRKLERSGLTGHFEYSLTEIVWCFEGEIFVVYNMMVNKSGSKKTGLIATSSGKPQVLFLAKFNENLELIGNKALEYNGNYIEGVILRIENGKLLAVDDWHGITKIYELDLTEY